MATIRFTGNAEAVAQVDTFTPANVEIGDIFTLTVTGLDGTTHAVSFVATAATVANVTAGLVAAWNNDTDALCPPITGADNTPTLPLTADTAGTAFSVASTAVNGGAADTQTLTRAATTANAGPSDWSSADNWSGGAVPGGAASQDVYVEGATILYGLDQSAIANTLSSLNISKSQIGSNPADGYLATYLQIKASVLNIGRHNGPGTAIESTPVNIDVGSTACAITVYNTGTNSTSTLPAVRIKANSASTTLNVKSGKVGVATESGETTTVSSITASSGSSVYIGSGVTLTTLNVTGGTVQLYCAATTVNVLSGSLTTEGSGAITTMNITGGTVVSNTSGAMTTLNMAGGTATIQTIATTVNISGGTLTTEGSTAVTTMNVSGGTVYSKSTGTITTLNIADGMGTVDFTTSKAARTVTTIKLEVGGVLKYDPNVLTITNKVDSDNPVKLTAAAA